MIALRALFVAAGLVVIWQGIVLIFDPPPFMLPGPALVLAALSERPELWQVHAPTTLIETILGLVIGSVLGILLALVMSYLPPTRRLLLPVMVVSQAIPVFAIAPLLVLWFGFGLASKIVMATIAIFFPVASAFHDGLLRTDQNLIDLARLHSARPDVAPGHCGLATVDRPEFSRRGRTPRVLYHSRLLARSVRQAGARAGGVSGSGPENEVRP